MKKLLSKAIKVFNKKYKKIGYITKIELISNTQNTAYYEIKYQTFNANIQKTVEVFVDERMVSML